MNAPRMSGAAVIVAAIAGAALAPLAQGDNYGNFDGSAGGKPDNSEHTYCFSNEFTGGNSHEGGTYAMHNLDDQTTMFDNQVPDCGANTDAKFHIAQLGFDGQWTCVDSSGNYCLSSRLEFDHSSITSLNDWKQTACHEVGHSVGLAHGDGSDCMGTQHDDPNDREYDGHHVNHINSDRF